MKHILRPVVVGILGLAVVAAAPAQSKLSRVMQEMNPLISHSPGYLGVMVSDVDSDAAAKQKLKEVHGAVITLIDHDAPAGPALRVNDVVLQVNGQNVENADQFSRMLREIPAGHKVSLLISRDGTQQTVTVELCDRKAMEQNVWNKVNKGESLSAPPTGMAMLPGGGDGMPEGHMRLFTSSLHVGAVIEPLTGQMADYLGVMNGVMVKHVDRKSAAAAAGLKQFDVILKVGNELIKTTADWDRALRANEGKTVQVTILRERKQQTVNLLVESKHKSEMQWEDIFPDGSLPELAELNDAFGPQFAEQMKQFGDMFTPEQRKELEKQAEQLSEAFKKLPFTLPEMKIDPKQMEDLQKQMQEFQKSFSIEQFRIDPKEMEELNRQMEEWRKSLPQMPCLPGQFIRYELEAQQLYRPA